MTTLKHLIYKSFFTNKVGKFILSAWFRVRFPEGANYWENRYHNKGSSGPGSYGAQALYKSGIVNKFVKDNHIAKIIEFGCGDGNQLQQFEIDSYIGLDVSLTAIEKCVSIFENDLSKSFFIYNPKGFTDHLNTFAADLSLSLDVIYHLLEDDVFERYMTHLFSSSTKFVIIYAWDLEASKYLHVRHRKFTTWIGNNLKNWHLVKTIKNESPQVICDFFIYQKDIINFV